MFPLQSVRPVLHNLLPLLLSVSMAGVLLFPDYVYTAGQWLPLLAGAALLCLWAVGAKGRTGRLRLTAAGMICTALVGWTFIVDIGQGMLTAYGAATRVAVLLLVVLTGQWPAPARLATAVVAVLTAACAVGRLLPEAGVPVPPFFQSPAGYAAVLSMGLPFVLPAAVRSARPLMRAACVAAVAAGLAALLLTGSRSGWLAALAAAGYIAARTPRFVRLRRRTKAALLLAAGGGLVAATAGLYALRPASADGRLLIYRVTAECIADAPLTGHGRAGLTRDYMPRQADFLSRHPRHPAARLADNVPYAFNEWAGFVLRYGLVGLVLLGVFLWTLLRPVFLPAGGSAGHTYLTACGAALAALATLSLLSYPLSFPPVLLMALLAATAAHGRQPALLHLRPGSAALRCGAAAGGVAAILCTVPAVAGECLWHRGEAAPAEQMRHYARAHRCLSGRPEFLYNYAAALNLAGDYAASDRLLAECRRELNDYDTELLAADNALSAGRTARAECHLNRAAAMIPARFMPLYGLLSVAEATGDTAGRRHAARAILAKRVKVPSAEVDEIRAEARRVLRPAE